MFLGKWTTCMTCQKYIEICSFLHLAYFLSRCWTIFHTWCIGVCYVQLPNSIGCSVIGKIIFDPFDLWVPGTVFSSKNNFWLVVYLPLWKIWVRQLGLLFPTYGTIKFMFQRFPKHQPDLDAFSLQDHRLWLGILWGGLRAQSPMATSTPPWCSNRGKCISSQGAEQRRAMCHGDFHAKTFCCSILPNTENPPIFSR